MLMLLYVDVTHLAERIYKGDRLRGNKWYVVNTRAFVSVLREFRGTFNARIWYILRLINIMIFMLHTIHGSVITVSKLKIVTYSPSPSSGATQPIVGVYFTALYRALASSLTRLLDHTQWRTTVGRTPPEEWSIRRRDLYLTTHNTHNRQTSMPRLGFQPTIAADERP